METEKKSIATALAKAQMEMGKALKSATNPHFRSKYADLASVVDACLPALNSNGIAVIQPTGSNEQGNYVSTIFIHGESGESLECLVPLIIGKSDMQGYGSAVTYARRYGLMAMAGIAPEDDDGNAAAKAAPRQAQQQAQQQAPRPQQPAPSAWKAAIGNRVFAGPKCLNESVAALKKMELSQPDRKEAFAFLSAKADSMKCTFDKAASAFVYLPIDTPSDRLPDLKDLIESNNVDESALLTVLQANAIIAGDAKSVADLKAERIEEVISMWGTILKEIAKLEVKA